LAYLAGRRDDYIGDRLPRNIASQKEASDRSSQYHRPVETGVKTQRDNNDHPQISPITQIFW